MSALWLTSEYHRFESERAELTSGAIPRCRVPWFRKQLPQASLLTRQRHLP